MNNIDDYNLPLDLLVNNNIKNLILLSSKTELNVFNKKKDKWVFKSKDTLLRDYEKIKKKELKSLEQIKKKELKEIQQINKKEMKDTHYSLSYLSQLGNNNYSVFKNKIDILDKIYDCITNIDITTPDDKIDYPSHYIYNNKSYRLITKEKQPYKFGVITNCDKETTSKNSKLEGSLSKKSLDFSDNLAYQALLDKIHNVSL